MNTITERFPFCYTMKDASKIYLFVLVKVPNGMTITFPADGGLDGQTYSFSIELEGTASSPGNGVNHYKYYNFDKVKNGQTIEKVEVKTKLKTASSTSIIKTMTIAVDIMDEVSPQLPLPNPGPTGNSPALNTPYVCTILNQPNVNVLGFDAEIYIKTDSPKTFTDSQSPPSGGSTVMNTTSTITSSGSTGSLDHSVKHLYAITDVHITDGAHTAVYNNGRKGKTKNKHHNKTPFPRLRRRPRQ